MNDLDPYRNLENDRLEAIAEIFIDERPLSDFAEDRRAAISLVEALGIAKTGYRPFLKSRSLVGLPVQDVRVRLLEEKGAAWADLALSWLRTSIPAVIFVRIISGAFPEYLLGDGHHRLALAGALGHSAIHAVFLVSANHRRMPANQGIHVTPLRGNHESYRYNAGRCNGDCKSKNISCICRS